MAAPNEGPDYFTLGGRLDYLRFLVIVTKNEPPNLLSSGQKEAFLAPAIRSHYCVVQKSIWREMIIV